MAQSAPGRCHARDDARVKDTRNDRRKEKNKGRTKKHGESIMERFDEMADAQLHKHRKPGNVRIPNLQDSPEINDNINLVPKLTPRNLPKNLTSLGNLSSHLSNNNDNGLNDAIDCLIRAEDMSKFAEKIIAAEAAVANVPRELAEEAALAVTRSYQDETGDKVTKIREVVHGDTIIEVVGYIGIRRKKPDGLAGNSDRADGLCSCDN